MTRRTVLWATVALCGAFQLLYLPLAARGSRVQPRPPSVEATEPSVQATLPSPQVGGGARLLPDPPALDLGTVPPGQERVLEVTLRNPGPKTAQVARVWSTCGCTSALLSEQRVPAGGTARLEVRFTGKAPGPFVKSVFVVLEYPGESIRVDLRGTVSP